MSQDHKTDGAQGKSFRELVEHYNQELLRYNRAHAAARETHKQPAAYAQTQPETAQGYTPQQMEQPFNSSQQQMEQPRGSMEQPLGPVQQQTEILPPPTTLPTTPPQPAPTAPELDGEPGSIGYLQVQVATGRSAFPIEGAYVSITRPAKNGTEELQRLLYTGRDGNTAVVALPAANAELSQQPGVKEPFTYYNIRVDYPGYFSVRNINVPLFGGITSIQPVELIPLPENYQGNGMTEFNEETPQPQNL